MALSRRIKSARKGPDVIHRSETIVPVAGSRTDHHDSLTIEEQLTLESGYRYCNKTEEERQMIDSVLFGKVSLNDLPDVKAKVVRVYLSSIATDFVHERNALMEKTYPRLRKILREENGIEFQAIDLRWGCRASNDDESHEFKDFALKQIEDCQKASIGPSFVAFLGQKYGHNTLPATLEHTTFSSIVTTLKDDGHDTARLEKYYILDENSVPKTYTLQISHQDTVHRELADLLELGVKSCVRESLLHEKILTKQWRSGLEAEISKGLLSADDNHRKKHCVCFFRAISQLPKKMTNEMKENALRYFDLVPEGRLEVDTRLKEMKSEVTELMDRELVHESCVDWLGKEGVSSATHQTYLQDVCTLFEKSVMDIVRLNLRREATLGDGLYNEALQHWKLAQMYCENFSGKEELERVKQYLFADTRKILVLHGVQGAGKTTLMAKAASEVQRIFLDMNLPIAVSVVLRFLGVTPRSTNVYQMMRSVCHQVAYTGNNYRHKIPKDMKGIKKYFMDMIQKGEFNGMLVLFLDSLEELVDIEDSNKLNWLPSRLAENVRIIVSTKQGNRGTLDRLQSIIDDPEMFFQVETLLPKDSETMLRCYLENSGRTVVEHQWNCVRGAIEKCQEPLFVYLLFQQIRQWRSWTIVTDGSIGSSVDECLDVLFADWEERHGEVFVSHSLGYLTASKNGLSDAEMLDLLSLDDDVLNVSMKSYHPVQTVRRCPPLLWTKLKEDLKPFVCEREADEILVISWRHAAFRQKADDRYLKTTEQQLHFHRHLSDYYLGKWGGIRKKSFQYPIEMIEELNLPRHSSACRLVPEQPNTFPTENGLTVRYNLRKLSQLPYHLAKSGNLDLLRSEVYFNYEWIYTKLRGTSLPELLSDYRYLDEPDINIVASSLKMSETTLLLNPNLASLELTGRLLPHYVRFSMIQQLIDQCDHGAMKHYPLVPNFQLYTTPGGPLQYLCQVDTTDSLVDVNLIRSPDSVLLSAKPSNSNILRVWDVSNGEPRPDIILSGPGDIYPTPDGTKLIMFSNDKTMQVYGTSSGILVSEIEYGHGKPVHVAVTDRYIAFTLEKVASPYIVDLELNKILHKLSYQSQIVALSQDGKYLICNIGHQMAVHEIPSMDRKCVIPGDEVAKQIQFMSRNNRLYILTGSKTLQSVVIDVRNRKSNTNKLIQDITMEEFTLSHTERYILVRCASYIFLFETSTNKLVHKLETPSEVFCEERSKFVGAAFSQDDALVVAAKTNNLALWDTQSGRPLRLLHVSTTPIKKLLTTNLMNKGITLLENNKVQVWNFTNLCVDLRHRNEVSAGVVAGLAVSENGVLVCHGRNHADGAVIDLGTPGGDTLYTFQHSEEPNVKISSLEIGRFGKYMITRGTEKDSEDSPFSTQDVLWEASSGKKLLFVDRVSQSIVSDIGNVAAFFVQRSIEANESDSLICILYDILNDKEEQVNYPAVMLVSKPSFDAEGHNIVYLGKAGVGEVRLLIQPVRSKDPINSLELKDIKSDAEDMSFLDVWPHEEDEDCIVIIYGTTGTSSNKNALDISKGLLVFDIKRWVLKHEVQPFMSNDSCTKSLISKDISVAVDDKFRVFDFKLNTSWHLSNVDAQISDCRLLLNGSYLVCFSGDKSQLEVVRTTDGVVVASCYIHGCGSCLEVGHDGRTIIVGCDDGRAMVLTFIHELSDPVRECISFLPSRQKVGREQTNMLTNDVKRASATIFDQKRLASKKSTERHLKERKPPSFRTVSAAAMILRSRSTIYDSNSNLNTSSSCTVQ